MKSVARLCLLAITLLSVDCARDIVKTAGSILEQDKPWFCHDLDCPRFDLLNKTDGYETRKYQAGGSFGIFSVDTK